MKRILTNIAIIQALTAMALLTGACKERSRPRTKGVGDRLQAFIIQDCDQGSKYCQVCKYGGKPTIMAVGDMKDSGFEADLVEIQKLVNANEGLTAFAVVGDLGGGGIKPFGDEKAAMSKLAALREKLDLTYPVVIVPKDMSEKQRKNYLPFNKAYEVEASRTILLGGADNKITFATVLSADNAKDHLAKLAEAVKKVM